ncbi:MFS transporter [Caballeronia sp. LZ035]|uniref:MFS transporter n=1 Tax=Caballeronia sp. LZ035 TaxID=3038568 RepID=UPI0028624F90|nr:MFS transporter [Caballeronia sp. LZ035]MDR5759644.1 MFS transporter [Caballeronia sp. LZ035]
MYSNSSSATAHTASDAVFRKVTLRILPLLFISYVLNYLDRLNIGYAQLQMKQDLHFSDAIYGLGAAVYFVGYMAFTLPSNLMLPRIGARKTILRIMFCWGLASAGTMLVKTPMQFYIARFLVGMFEAGFFPGIILYLTYWYPPARRARIVSMFMLATVTAGFTGGVVSGWILQNMGGAFGLQAWQWMFLLEGLPACLFGLLVYWLLVDKPAQARWLNDAEKDVIAREIAEAGVAHAETHGPATRSPFMEAKVYVLSFALFCALCGSYTLAFWLPTMIHELGVKNLQHLGLYATIPDICAACAMILYGRHSDARKERRWHFGLGMIVGAAALCATSLTSHSLGLSIALFAIAKSCISSSIPIFWAMATGVLSARANVAGIAVIVSISDLAGVTSPFALGTIKTATGSLNNGIYMIGALMVSAAFAVLIGIARSPSARDARVVNGTSNA